MPQPTTPTLVLRLAFVIALCIAAPSLRAEPVVPVARAVGVAPLSSELIIVVDGLADARSRPAATGLLAALDDLGLVGAISSRWSAVATQLGWNELETFDRILGTRVVLIISGLESGADPTWLLLSEISADTDIRLKERIPIAQRKAVDGTPVFALERGEYELATFRPAGPDSPRVSLLLGPARAARSFDAMARTLSRNLPGELAATPVVREFGDHASPGILVALRIDPAARPEAPPTWNDFLVCTAVPDGAGWECRLTIRDAELRDEIRHVAPSSDAPFLAMSRGAMLAVLESRLAAANAEPSNPFERLLALFTVPSDAGAMLTGRQAIAVWPRGPAAKDPSLPPTICCAFALETSDVARTAPIADRHLGGLVQRLEQVLGGAALPVPDFAGVATQAVRSVSLDLPADASIRRVFDGQAQIAWSYPTSDSPDAPTRGWWQVCITGDGDPARAEACARDGGACAEASRQLVSALINPHADGRVDRWVSIGLIRPARWSPILQLVTDALGDQLPRGPGLVRFLARIDRAEWRLAARDNDDVSGTVKIKMTAPTP